MHKTSSRWTPKYWQLVEQFRQQIEFGLLKPGDRLPSYTEMRVQHGVSRPTTEKVHTILERDGLIVREPGRGTFIAEPKVQGKQAVIGFAGFAHNNSRHPYFMHLLDGIHEVANREKMEVLLLNDASTIEWEKVDGMVLCDMAPDLWLRRLPPGMPHVILLLPSDEASSVVADDQDGVYQATRHLLELGHRKIAYFSSTLDHAISLRRLSGFRRAMKEGHLDIQPDWIHPMPLFRAGSTYFDRGLEAMRAWIQNGWRETGCTAILAANDDAGMGAIQAMQEAGIRVPQDVSLVGFDGTEVSRFFSPPLTTIEVPLTEISVQGTELLLRHIRANQSPLVEHIVLPTRLIVRESTAAPVS